MANGQFGSKVFALTLGVIRQVRTREYPFALRTFYRALKIPLNFPGHIALLRVLTRPAIIGLTSRHPLLVYKYLGTYLASSFTRKTRLAIQTNHYRYLSERLNEHILARLVDRHVSLWEGSIDSVAFSTALHIPLVNDNEGDIALFFEINAEKIYDMSFTIAPGAALQLDEEQVLLIGRVQGVGGKYELIRQAGKSCHGILPGRLLLYAAEAIGQVLGIRAIVGLGNGVQILKDWSEDAKVVFDYDEFWCSFNAEKAGGNLFVLGIPFTDKPMVEVKSSRRAQALRKRTFREQFMDRVRTRFQEECLSAKETQ